MYNRLRCLEISWLINIFLFSCVMYLFFEYILAPSLALRKVIESANLLRNKWSASGSFANKLELYLLLVTRKLMPLDLIHT